MLVGMLLFKGRKMWGGFGWECGVNFTYLLVLKATVGNLMGIFQELLMAIKKKM